MAPDGIVEAVDVAGNGPLGLGAGLEDGPPDELGFSVLKNVSTMALSKQFPLPDIEIRMPCRRSSAW